MNGRKLVGLACLIAGVLLLYFGYTASQSLAESVSETFRGRFTDDTTWMLIGGAVATIVGLVLLLRR